MTRKKRTTARDMEGRAPSRPKLSISTISLKRLFWVRKMAADFRETVLEMNDVPE